MSSITIIILRKKSNKLGLFPLAILVTKNRKSNYLYIGHYVNLKDWDENKKMVRKSYQNADYLNNLLASKLSETLKVLLELQTNDTYITSKQIKKEITFKNNGESFFEVADIHMSELVANNKFSRLSVDKAYLDHLLNFAQSRRLSFQDINETFLKGHKAYIMNNKSLSERSAVNHLILIRTLYNRAIREGIVDQKFYPFGMGKIKIKFPESRKVGLTTEEIKAIEQLKNLTREERHARNVWLFSFYLAGIRIGDVLKIRWGNIYDGKLHYTMNKNSKLVSLQLPEKSKPILKKYEAFKTNENDFLFPELKKADAQNPKDNFSNIKTANKRLNRQLAKVAGKAKIYKKTTIHIARHSFEHIA